MTYGLIGEKLGHSYSKLIHEMLGRYEYNLFSLDNDTFKDFVSERKFNGLNITIPYKKAVIPMCDEVSSLAQEIGSVNTLYWSGDKLCGTNTDYQGFLYAAEKAGISFNNKKVLILGNGGTSLTARKAVRDSGAREVLITSRREESGCVSYENLLQHRDVQIIVNTTPVGTYPDNGSHLISLKDFPVCEGVIDVIYNPFATELLLEAKELGIPHSNGLPMLVAQATAAAEYFLGESGFKDENARIIDTLEKDIENIVLIGMPGCGKSTLGKRLAQKTGKTFVDMDSFIIEKAGMTIPEIFDKYGEKHFRDIESEVAAELGKENRQVIATGGGVILRHENMKALSQNGRILFIKRPLEKLAKRGRPLSKDLNTLKVMYERRLPLYNKYSQLVINAGRDINKNVDKMCDLLGHVK